MVYSVCKLQCNRLHLITRGCTRVFSHQLPVSYGVYGVHYKTCRQYDLFLPTPSPDCLHWRIPGVCRGPSLRYPVTSVDFLASGKSPYSLPRTRDAVYPRANANHIHRPCSIHYQQTRNHQSYSAPSAVLTPASATATSVHDKQPTTAPRHRRPSMTIYHGHTNQHPSSPSPVAGDGPFEYGKSWNAVDKPISS